MSQIKQQIPSDFNGIFDEKKSLKSMLKKESDKLV